MLRMLEDNVIHIGVATDHGFASFRNKLWPDYKNSEGIELDLLRQFHLLEDALEAFGINAPRFSRRVPASVKNFPVLGF